MSVAVLYSRIRNSPDTAAGEQIGDCRTVELSRTTKGRKAIKRKLERKCEMGERLQRTFPMWD